MNKTLSIGLAGFSFIIEEHAYIKLSDYLSALRNSLEASEADEVMHDIEIRMVEIFKDSLGKREVINAEDVDRVVNQIGRPEVIEEQEEAYYSQTTSNKTKNTTYNGQRQLFRDPERQKVAGVCAGLAHYTGMDITLMRAIWLIIAILGLFTAAISTTVVVLLYIILWIVLPKAETASDFLKMKGKPVNFDNLKEESTKIVQFANESTQRVGEIYNENKPYINRAGSSIWNVFRYIVGAFFAFIGGALLLSSFAVFGVSAFGSGDINFFDNLGFYLQDSNLGFLVVALGFLTLFIPALIFCYIAIKLFSPKTKLNNTGYVIGALALIWIALSSAAGFSALKYKSQYSGENEETQNVAITTESDSLLLDINKVTIPANFKSYWDDVYSDGKSIFKEDHIYVEVKREDIKEPYIVLKKRADGYNHPLNMDVPLKISGNTISFPNYFRYDYKDRFRDYRLDYELVVPRTMKIIKLKEWGINVDDESEESINNSGIQIEKDKVIINGQTISYDSNDKDSIIINDRKYPKAQAEKMLDSLNIDLDEMKNLNIQINNGEKEISIKTK